MEFRILGPLEVVDDGRELPVGGAKQRALLALLLLHANRVVSRDRLIDELWEDDPPETARTALQVHVSQLRKVLGRERIVTQVPGYLVRVEPDELDLERFERMLSGIEHGDSARAAETLREALALWRGLPLGNLDGSFASAERARLEERHVLALEQRIDAELALGLHAELVPELEALVRENPLRERLRAQLMLALYRSGRQADALEVYRQGRRLLADELGLEPGEELRRLEKAILEHDASLVAPEPPAAALAVERSSEHRRLRLIAVVGAGLLVAALATGIVLATRGSAGIMVRPNSVAALDITTGKVLADVPIGGRPIAIALGGGSVWVADADNSTVSRIDAKTKERLPIGGLGSDVHDLAFGLGSLWVAGGNDGTVWRVDPHTNGVQRVGLGRAHGGLPQPVFTVRVGAGAVWVTRGNELLRIDPAGARVTMRRPIPASLGLAVGGSVWLATQDERIVRIDARTLKTVYAHELPQLAFFPLVAERSVWVVGSPGLRGDVTRVWRFDPGTLTLDAAIALAKVPAYGLAAGGGKVWTIDVETGGVWRIDPRTNEPSRLADVGHHPVAVAAGTGVVWVGVQKELP